MANIEEGKSYYEVPFVFSGVTNIYKLAEICQTNARLANKELSRFGYKGAVLAQSLEPRMQGQALLFYVYESEEAFNRAINSPQHYDRVRRHLTERCKEHNPHIPGLWRDWDDYAIVMFTGASNNSVRSFMQSLHYSVWTRR